MIIKKKLRKIVSILLLILSLTSALYSIIPTAFADSSGILGTNSALGSPILNNDATVNNWNKWEIICWGVFLSNFCQPLVDNYQTAFQKGKGGSDGAGYEALVMGTGNDATNNETIES